MIVEAFYSHVIANPAVAAITTSLFPHTIPQEASLPAMTYSVGSDDRFETLDGVSGLKTATIDLDCWSRSYLEAHALADAVESALASHTGVLGSSKPAITADHVRLERKFDLFESPTELHRVSMQFTVAYY